MKQTKAKETVKTQEIWITISDYSLKKIKPGNEENDANKRRQRTKQRQMKEIANAIRNMSVVIKKKWMMQKTSKKFCSDNSNENKIGKTKNQTNKRRLAKK